MNTVFEKMDDIFEKSPNFGIFLCLSTLFAPTLALLKRLDKKNYIPHLQFFSTKDFKKNAPETIKESLEKHNDLYTSSKENEDHITEKRKQEYADMVQRFYNLVTDFYTYAWGYSFHFAPRFKTESFQESIKRYEYYLSNQLGLSKNMKCLDVGCGVGGPMRNIANFSGANIDGVTINAYQAEIGRKKNKEMHLEEQCKLHEGDYQHLSFLDNTFDAAFAIESTCHSPDKKQVFSEIFRVLKPGARFADYEWILTEKFDYENKNHVKIKKEIEIGNGIPDLTTKDEILGALEEVGFKIEKHFDANANLHAMNEIPWYHELNQELVWDNFKTSFVGRFMTSAALFVLEKSQVVPKGSTSVSMLLAKTATYLVKAGKEEIFTPSYFIVAVKPDVK
jgi:sterol 24-C-methyltransferase